jgi:AmiR/NasT family two-component response regulator
MRFSQRYRVLVTDDDALIVDLIQEELETLGHTVVGRAADGREAIALAQHLQPDVVLMDISMPVLDGLEATRRIQETNPRPIVLLTAHDEPEFVERASAVGAGAYLVKPPRGPELGRALAIAVARFADLQALRRLNAELQAALAQVKRLSGLIPMCSCCRKVRDDRGYWQQVEQYISEHSDARVSHGMCPDCIRRMYPDIADEVLEKMGK